ncbi:hypothetical protein JRO89_XS04G0277500 [Xanthoceras sorbifolium]|uniref:Uncharacterized protein n=1 Tax=Xanthoceras sorbifolium TaxID=99658 RepID=A0ABQ8I7J1_9ROSI|nr:hypothetical protein JRO89_XS04G0277500 [Xanthoceras sorbifolium]
MLCESKSGWFYCVLQGSSGKSEILDGTAKLFCSVILFPIAITFYITWWFIHFVDGFFSPIYAQLGIDIFGKQSILQNVAFLLLIKYLMFDITYYLVFHLYSDLCCFHLLFTSWLGLGFITSMTFIFMVGVFMSSWLGTSVLSLGEWFIRRMPFVRHIYNASKQISAAISPDQNKQAFKEVAIIRHPRIGEYAFGFITSSVILQNNSREEELFCVYVPTNHLYIGDIFLINANDVIRPNLSVREGIGLLDHYMVVLFVHQLQKLLFLAACQCPRSCQRWTPACHLKEVDLTEAETEEDSFREHVYLLPSLASMEPSWEWPQSQSVNAFEVE